MTKTYLTQKQLAERWNMSPRTLERQRWDGTGCTFVKIGNLVRYDLKDVEAYEERRTIER